MEDREGLSEAYKNKEGVYAAGDTLFVAGTKSAGDVLHDVSIPLGLTSTTNRFKDASLALSKMPQIQRIVGHSIGGAVALELQRNHPELKTVTYGAPVVSASSGERYRHWGDPVAAFDWGAKTTASPQLNPHSYSTLAARKHAFAPGTWKDGYSKNGVPHYFR